MASELPLYESEINGLIKEYFTYAGLDKASYSFQLECKERGKAIPQESQEQRDGSKLTAQNNILLEFDSGNYSAFWSLWEEFIPTDIQQKDQTCQRLEFYIQIHFAVFPIRVGTVTPTSGTLEQSMTQFKTYLESRGSNLSQTTEFLPFYALPFVPNPVQHPSFKELFSNYWVPDLRARVDKFLSAAFSSTELPLLLTLVQNKGRLSSSENPSQKVTEDLQQNLIQAEKRCAAYMKRFNKLQTDYHTLISITAELVDSLEQTVHGKMVTVEYLQQVCARLFNNRGTGGGGNFNLASVDFTRPGTASSMLRASIAAPPHEGFVQHNTDSPLLPSLDFSRIKSDLKSGSPRNQAILLQALRWRLTRSTPGEQRETILMSYIDHDLFTCRPDIPASQHRGFSMLALFESDDVAVRQYAARLYNALSSLQKGRAYLSMNPRGIGTLQNYLWLGHGDNSKAIDHVFEEHLLGCLQKLSLRRVLQSVMIEGDLIKWLVHSLGDHESLSDYMLEYAVALLMNLCLRTSGKRKCGECATEILKVLCDLLAHDNMEIRPYVNGALYSVLSNPVVREEAREMGLEAMLRDFMDGQQDEFRRQLEFIIKQLNKPQSEEETGNLDVDSDDEGDEDDDEDQDAMEADLDKDEVVLARPNELCGEMLLSSEYLGLLNASINAPLSELHSGGILQRPSTPSNRASLKSRGGGVNSSSIAMASFDLKPLQDSMNLAASVQNMPIQHSSRPATSASRPATRSGSRPGSRSGAQTERSARDGPQSSHSSRSRQLPIDHEASLLVSELTGVSRNLHQPASQTMPTPGSAKKAREYTSAFSSRPKIPRTPDVSQMNTHRNSPRISSLNPTFSQGEPVSRPTSSSSSKGSGGSGGESYRTRRQYSQS